MRQPLAPQPPCHLHPHLKLGSHPHPPCHLHPHLKLGRDILMSGPRYWPGSEDAGRSNVQTGRNMLRPPLRSTLVTSTGDLQGMPGAARQGAARQEGQKKVEGGRWGAARHAHRCENRGTCPQGLAVIADIATALRHEHTGGGVSRRHIIKSD